MKKNGFTLVEILAVIAVLGILITIASKSVITIMNREKQKLVNETQKNLESAAIAYIQSERITLTTCNTSFDPQNPKTNERNCFREIKVNDIIKSGLFTDDQKYCDRESSVLVYRYKSAEYSDYRAYIKEGTCK